MRAILQRVHSASVWVQNKLFSSIDQDGWFILLAIHKHDTQQDVEFIVHKILNTRCFSNLEGKMDLNISEIKGCLLVVSQFTLYANFKKGRRLSFSDSAAYEKGLKMYDLCVSSLKEEIPKTEQGKFDANMEIQTHAYGPVTLILDSRE